MTIMLDKSPQDGDQESRGGRLRPSTTTVQRRFGTIETEVHGWLAKYSVTMLRISLGAIIFGFGFLKFFPGVSPAEDLILATTAVLTFGLVPGPLALVLLAIVECTIGLSLMTGRGLRVTIYLVTLWLLGVLSPAVVLFSELFSGPNFAPTLEAQYVLKDVVLLAAVMVIATTLCRRKDQSDQSASR